MAASSTATAIEQPAYAPRVLRALKRVSARHRSNQCVRLGSCHRLLAVLFQVLLGRAKAAEEWSPLARAAEGPTALVTVLLSGAVATPRTAAPSLEKPREQSADCKHSANDCADAREEVEQRPPPLFNGEHHWREVVREDGSRHHLLVHLRYTHQTRVLGCAGGRARTFDEVKYSVTLY